jgi:hypothetical protein
MAPDNLPEQNQHPRSASDKERLTILLADYAASRDDDRSLIAAQAAVFSVAVTILGLLAAAVSQTCDFVPSGRACVRIPDYVLGTAPLLPLALFAYLLMLGTVSTIRSYYMRGLEEEIRKYSPEPLGSLKAVWPASYMGIVTELISMRRGKTSYRLLANIIILTVIITFLGITIYIALHVSTATQIGMTIVYGLGFIVLASESLRSTRSGRSQFLSVASQFLVSKRAILPKVELNSGGSHKRKGRGIVSYLIYPRPEDWVKLLVVPGVFVATAWSAHTLDRWRQFLLLWFVLEYLIYNARYQWNDVRGIKDDRSSSQRQARTRLPVGENGLSIRSAVRVSLIIAGLRIVLALAIGYLTDTSGAVEVLLLIVFATAVVYEFLRSLPIRRGPLGACVLFLLWLVVGLGYGLRAGLAFWLAGVPLSSLAGISGIACFITFGIMFVLLTWTLEAAGNCSVDATGHWYLEEAIGSKKHLIPLLKFCNIELKPRGEVPPGGCLSAGGAQRVLESRGWKIAPWNVALTTSVALGAVLGMQLSHISSTVPRYLTAITISIVGAALLSLCSGSARRLLTVGVVFAVLVVIAMHYALTPFSLLLAIPWCVIAGMYTMFRGSSYGDLKNFAPQKIRQVKKILKSAVNVVLWLVVGGQTLSDIKEEQKEVEILAHRIAREQRARTQELLARLRIRKREEGGRSI